MQDSDTIAAIATALTNSGISIIRISGENALSIMDKIYRSKNGLKKISEQSSHTIHYGYIYDGDQLIDEVMVLLMHSPNSYTKEDVVEIDCHGGSLVTKRILEAILSRGVRLAEPGEFTKRAFLNGRIDLSQAESVMDLISAKNDFALQSSLRQLKGSVKEIIGKMRERLLYEIAFIESALDDPEHISLEGYEEKLLLIVREERIKIKKLLSDSENGILLKDGIQTVIVGRPNAGKSSLLNLLIGEDRAIVTEVPGTTRDILKEEINLEGITLHLVDTAGIRDSEDQIEQIGVEKAKKYLLNADLILYLIDGSKDLERSDNEMIELIQGKKTIVLLNKYDLGSALEKEELQDRIKQPVIDFSVKEKVGIEELVQTIKNLFFQGKISIKDEWVITNARHVSALQEAKKSLDLVEESIVSGLPEDFYSIDLMNAYEELGRIIGESVGEDLVNEIFSKFCMGK
ncbi:tRNA modification GTPase MnmE [Clostridia bacterium]|nr:tRNA modification GTPase MnmE [Clostridia bacterium]